MRLFPPTIPAPTPAPSRRLPAVSPALSTSEVILQSRKGRGQAGSEALQRKGKAHALLLQNGKVNFLPADDQEATQRQAGATTNRIRQSKLCDYKLRGPNTSENLGRKRQLSGVKLACERTL